MSGEERFLNYLGLNAEAPDLVFLKRLVHAHLERVPYESVSKLILAPKIGPTIPDFETYSEQLYEFGFGGTCFAKNIYLVRLLSYLGFDARLVNARREGPLSHVSIRVTLGAENYLIDVGLMSPFAGPYLLNPVASFKGWLGELQYIYSPADDLENYSLEILRGEKVARSFHSTSTSFSNAELETGIARTYKTGSLFMTTLCAQRSISGISVGLWNRQIYRINGEKSEKREIGTLEDLQRTFEDELGLPNYPVKEALERLIQNGAEPLFAN